MSGNKKVIAITGLEGRDNPYPGAAIARCLREARGDQVRLIGLSYDARLTSCFRHDLFDQIYLTPLPGDPAATLLRRLKEINEKEGIDLLIPALDSELAIFALHRNDLADLGIRMVIPSAESVRSRYKQRLASWAHGKGIFSPLTEVVTNPHTFFDQEHWNFPCYFKGSLADAVKVHDLAEAEVVFHRLVHKWGFPILAQQPLNGVEYDVCAVARPDGSALSMICIQKTTLSRAGKAIGFETVDDADALAAARDILVALQWEGPLEIEMLREESSGRFFLIEVNARFPAWVGASPATGINLPDIVVRLAFEEALPQELKPKIGARFLRASHTSITSAGALGSLLQTGSLDHSLRGS